LGQDVFYAVSHTPSQGSAIPASPKFWNLVHMRTRTGETAAKFCMVIKSDHRKKGIGMSVDGSNLTGAFAWLKSSGCYHLQPYSLIHSLSFQVDLR